MALSSQLGSTTDRSTSIQYLPTQIVLSSPKNPQNHTSALSRPCNSSHLLVFYSAQGQISLWQSSQPTRRRYLSQRMPPCTQHELLQCAFCVDTPVVSLRQLSSHVGGMSSRDLMTVLLGFGTSVAGSNSASSAPEIANSHQCRVCLWASGVKA